MLFIIPPPSIFPLFLGITQNVDGLHKVTGISRNNYSAMHGCVRTEKCSNKLCQTEYFRDYDIGGMSFQPTGRYCNVCSSKGSEDGDGDIDTSDNNRATVEGDGEGAGAQIKSQSDEKTAEVTVDKVKAKDKEIEPNGANASSSNNKDGSGSDQANQKEDEEEDDGGKQHALHDTLLDWDDPLPEDDFEYIQQIIEKPNTLVLCLGTSLRIEPIGLLPLNATEFVIVNLQKTPRDDQASLIIRANVNVVMEYVMEHIKIAAAAKPGFNASTSDTAMATATGEEESSGDNNSGKGRSPPQIERVWTPPPSRLNIAPED